LRTIPAAAQASSSSYLNTDVVEILTLTVKAYSKRALSLLKEFSAWESRDMRVFVFVKTIGLGVHLTSLSPIVGANLNRSR
jgi:hypothetical protein